MKKGGFTLVELLVTIAIISIIASAAVLSLSRYRGPKNIELSLNEFTGLARSTQKRAIAQENGQSWGIHFLNSTSTIDEISIFSGSSFVSSTIDKLYSLRRNISFGNPTSSSSIDVLFQAVSGKPTQNQIISLIDDRKDGVLGNLLFNKSGFISGRLENNVVGFWPFDENTSTTVYDASGIGNNGVLYSNLSVCANPPTVGCPIWNVGSNCKAGSCILSDGSNDYARVDKSSSLDFTGQFSFFTWVKRNRIQDWERIGGRYFYNSGDTGAWAMDAGQGFTRCYANIGGAWRRAYAPAGSFNSTGTWYYVGCTYDGTALRNYINGVEVASDIASGAVTATNYPFLIGATGDGASTQNWFYGNIDEVIIYNKALSVTEILNHYNDLK